MLSVCNWAPVQHRLCNPSSTFYRCQTSCMCPDDFYKTGSVSLDLHSACTAIYVSRTSVCQAAGPAGGLLSTWEIPDEQPSQWCRIRWNSSLPWEVGDLASTHQCRLESLWNKRDCPAAASPLLFQHGVYIYIYICINKTSIHLVSTYFSSPGKLPACCRCPLPLDRVNLGLKTWEFCQKK